MSQKPRDFLTGCESAFLTIKRRSLGKVEYRVFPQRCHTWDCPCCAKEKAKKYRERMRPLFDGRRLWMYTFTYYHTRSPLAVWSEYSKSWNRFRTAAVKRYGGFAYARILECHNLSPYPHLHIIADKEFGACWLGEELKSAGFGYQADCQPITTEGAIGYVTKYLTKPWKRDDCRQIRKNLRLRIISFGGDACCCAKRQDGWKLVARNLERIDADNYLDYDVAWNELKAAKVLSERIVDAMLERVYAIPGEETLIMIGVSDESS